MSVGLPDKEVWAEVGLSSGSSLQGSKMVRTDIHCVGRRADMIAPLKSTSALSDVHVSWPGARQAKVEIGETAMSFET
jgi:hypothetical protein